MGLLPSVKLSDEEKLATLQRLDQFREWRSLDEQRYCLSCGALITGRQIQVVGGSRGTGPLRAICATRNCHAIPMDWALPTDEVLTKMSPDPTAAGSSIKKGESDQKPDRSEGGGRPSQLMQPAAPRARTRSMLQTHSVSDPKPTRACAGNENSVAARLRNVAKHFRRSTASFSRT